MKKLKKTAKKSQKTKTFLAFLRLKKVKYLILWFLVKGLYFQNLRTEIFCLKISQAFGLNLWRKFFILLLRVRDCLGCVAIKKGGTFAPPLKYYTIKL